LKKVGKPRGAGKKGTIRTRTTLKRKKGQNKTFQERNVSVRPGGGRTNGRVGARGELANAVFRWGRMGQPVLFPRGVKQKQPNDKVMRADTPFWEKVGFGAHTG